MKIETKEEREFRPEVTPERVYASVRKNDQYESLLRPWRSKVNHSAAVGEMFRWSRVKRRR